MLFEQNVFILQNVATDLNDNQMLVTPKWILFGIQIIIIFSVVAAAEIYQ